MFYYENQPWFEIQELLEESRGPLPKFYNIFNSTVPLMKPSPNLKIKFWGWHCRPPDNEERRAAYTCKSDSQVKLASPPPSQTSNHRRPTLPGLGTSLPGGPHRGEVYLPALMRAGTKVEAAVRSNLSYHIDLNHARALSPPAVFWFSVFKARTPPCLLQNQNYLFSFRSVYIQIGFGMQLMMGASWRPTDPPKSSTKTHERMNHF